MVGFPAAGACAELLLAERKDAVYEGEVKNLLRELLERCCGTHLLSQVLPELTSASAMLYYLLVLGQKQPQQTLGEEYCDVLRVVNDTSPTRRAPVVKNVSLIRHLAWIAIMVLPRYLASRSQSGWLNLSQLTWSPRERMAQQLRQRQAAAHAAANGEPLPAQPLSQSLLSTLDRLVTRIKTLGEAAQGKLIPVGYEFSLVHVQSWLSQVHLAAFYVSAKFLQFAKRLAKIEYVFVRKDLQPALNLSVLGYLMFLRLTSTAIIELKRLRKMHKAEAKLKLADHSVAGATSRVPALSSLTGEAAVPASGNRRRSKKCALCLGERISPATTPCGHVFCWECIVGWCQKNKPECPICRQEAHPQQIKCVYNYN